jgi:hypothetical protein
MMVEAGEHRLASATVEGAAGSRKMEVACVRITDAGRRAVVIRAEALSETAAATCQH